MNTIKLCGVILILVCFCSCSTPRQYYQIYTARPLTDMKADWNKTYYEDENCVVSYNFWSSYGSVGFVFYNKTDRHIYLNKEESFFVSNGFAHNYYHNRSYSYSTSMGANRAYGVGASLSAGVGMTGSETGINYGNNLQTNSNSLSFVQGASKSALTGISMSQSETITYEEEKIIIIPPKTSKKVIGYTITSGLYEGNSAPLFIKENSPLVFGNRISYTLENSTKKINVENMFYVSRIANYAEKDVVVMKGLENDHNRENKSYVKEEIKEFNDKYVSPNSFYIPFQMHR